MKSLVGNSVEIETSKQHYKGLIVSNLFKTGKIVVKISEVLKGNKAVGKTATFTLDQVKSIS